MKRLAILVLLLLILAGIILPSNVLADTVQIHQDYYKIENPYIYQDISIIPESTTPHAQYKFDHGFIDAIREPADGTGKKLVCITFDDGWQNQYDNALPALQTYGFKATFAIVTTWIGGGSGASAAMGLSAIHNLADLGMDIASHTRTHPHLPALGTEDLQNEVANSMTELEAEGFTIRTLVYPYYEHNDTVIAAAQNAGYICARAGGLSHPFDPGDNSNPDDRYRIDTIEINTQNITQFQSIVAPASEHSVICLCYHSVSNSTSAPTPRTPVANFAEQMSYLHENGFTVVLLSDLLQNPWIDSEPSSMSFSYTEGGSYPAAQTLNISNSGGGTLNWTVTDDAEWLQLSPASGSTTGPAIPVTVTADVSGLSSGNYTGTITVTAAGASNTPQTVTVMLAVYTASPDWLDGWNYRKQVAVPGSAAGAQADYQMRLIVNRSAGVDTGSEVYIGLKCAADYSDIRFTGYDGITPLDYWIQSADSSSAVIWVEFDNIPASPDRAYFNLYYGNDGAGPYSNIQNTFVFADDFNDGVVDAARWATGGTGGSVAESGGVLMVTASSSSQKYASSVGTYSNNYSLHARVKLDSITDCSSFRILGFVTTRGTYADKNFTSAFRWYYAEPNFWGVSGDGSGSSLVNMNVARDINYHIAECRRYAIDGTNYDRFIIDNGIEVTGSKPTAVSRYIYICTDEYNRALIADWVFLRKYMSPEPSWGIWGSEEAAGGPPSPEIAFNPASLSFTGTVGGSNPASQTLNIWNSGGGTLEWTANDNADWLSLNPASGSSTGSQNPVAVSADLAGLESGAHNGTIVVTSDNASNSPQSIPVTFNVSASPPAINNASGATNITATSARLNGNLTSTGGAETVVHVCWGNNDGGTGAWDHDENLGVLGTGAFYFNASGLSNGAIYFYRCYAVNSSDTSWAESTSTFTARDTVRLLGADELAISSGNNHNDMVSLCRFTAFAYGSISQIRLKCSDSGNVKVAIYEDNAGSPAALLQSTGSIPVVSGWNIISLPSHVDMDSGSSYWLGAACDSSGVLCYHLGSGDQLFKTISFFPYSFPDPAGTGWNNNNNYVLIAGWGVKTIPGAPTVLAPGTVITFKWNPSENANAYWLQVNTAADFTGTNIVNAEVGNTTVQRVTGLSVGVTYYWRVKAGNARGWSNWSNTFSVTCNTVP
jgi:peptidoglycan/xylan/chitin deacetylase (PgdA/CDA1 family)